MFRHARVIRVRGIVQGVGFRPFTYRLAHRLGVTGWVKNGNDGVEMHVEADDATLNAFARALVDEAPPAARVAGIRSDPALTMPFESFEIRETTAAGSPTVRISPDLAPCDACVRELFDERDRRFRYPYVNCTDCGPRYSIVTALPYDRPNTTMAPWIMCDACSREYHDPFDRRFHAQPIACPQCGPDVVLEWGAAPAPRGYAAIEAAALALRAGEIVALKGVGGYLLACDPANATAVENLRARKYRKERPFALMAKDVSTARTLIALDAEAEAAIASAARPIVLGDARIVFDGVAPGNRELGVMLPSTPLHQLLFAAGAPPVLVATSGNRSNEPIAFEDEDARTRLRGVADLLLGGDRRIARRLDDSLVRAGGGASQVYRFARGFAPAAVARIASKAPILAVGADLKNAVALAVDGQVFMSQHIGDLEYRSAREACESTIADLCATYGVRIGEAVVVHDAHPHYVSTAIAAALSERTLAVQHHRAHVASVLAEREAWDTQVVGVAFDGTGYGDDGSIWGGEIFAGSIRGGFDRIAHLRPVPLPGGDAAARFPVQAAAGFLYDLDLPELENAPFHFGARYFEARQLIAKNVRCFTTTSIGRLFDTVAALLGFTRDVSFEAQAALWLEHMATSVPAAAPLEFEVRDALIDPRPVLLEIACARRRGTPEPELARGFRLALARAVRRIASDRPNRPVVCSGGVFANRLLCDQLGAMLLDRLWLNRIVPANDGGIGLGQVALAASNGLAGRGLR